LLAAVITVLLLSQHDSGVRHPLPVSRSLAWSAAARGW
jgi:hypothetical protein